MAELKHSETSSRFIGQIWSGFRPYLIKIAIDSLISASLWTVLFGFKNLTKALEIEGAVGAFIIHLHGAGTVAAFALFATLFLIDVWYLHTKSSPH